MLMPEYFPYRNFKSQDYFESLQDKAAKQKSMSEALLKSGVGIGRISHVLLHQWRTELCLPLRGMKSSGHLVAL